ncbi:MAG: hypothetical protein GC178_13030 [Flavobacteriales bacterium]|nr:hypothetical protein [Flavobacteriales bacterium]
MKHLLPSLFLLSVVLFSCKPSVNDEPIAEFQKTFPTTGNQEADRLIAVTDGIVMVGTSTVGSDKQLLLLKTDFSGNELWRKTMASGTIGSSIKHSSDGNLILAGSIITETNDNDLLLMKTDANGNILWQHRYGGSMLEIGNDVIELMDGGFMLTGLTQSFGAGVGKMFVVRTDADGNELWNRTFGGNGQDGGTALIQTDQTQVSVLGFTSSFGAGDRDIYIQGVSTDGDSLGAFFYGGSGYEESHAFELTSEGGFVMSNHSASNDPTHMLLATRLDANMQVVWENEFGTTSAHEGGEGVLADSEGNFVFLGRTNSFGNDEQVYFIKTDADGNTLEELNFGEAGDQRGYDITEHDGSYYFCGTSIVNNDADILLMKRPM